MPTSTSKDRAKAAGHSGPETVVEQPSLLDVDDAAQPVPFTLTARARRVVAPETLPSLTVVGRTLSEAPFEAPALGDASDGDAEGVDDLFDPRRARARALRRAGASEKSIAAELGMPTTTIAAWTEDVTPSPRARHRKQVAANRRERDLPVAWVTGRAAARAAWRRGEGSHLAAMVTGMADVTPFAVRLRGDVDTIAVVLRWLRDNLAIDEHCLRAQVLSAPGEAMDRVTHLVAEQLGLPIERVHSRPWADAPDADAKLVHLRISDPGVAGTIDGWRTELLADSGAPQHQVACSDVDPLAGVAVAG